MGEAWSGKLYLFYLDNHVLWAWLCTVWLCQYLYNLKYWISINE